MLVLTRKKGETILIGDDIEISVQQINGDQVKIGINAPKKLQIIRKELFDNIVVENKEAININTDVFSEMKNFKK